MSDPSSNQSVVKKQTDNHQDIIHQGIVYDHQQVKRFLVFVSVALCFLFMVFQVYRALLTPMCISLVLTYFLIPIVKQFERLRVPRGASVFLLLILTLGLVVFGAFRVLPYLFFETTTLIRMAPGAFDNFLHDKLPQIKLWVQGFGLISEEMINAGIGEMQQMLHVSERIVRAITTLWNSAPQVLGTLLNLVMIPLLTFFLVKDWETLKMRLVVLIPRDIRTPLAITVDRMNDAIRAVIRGQIIVAAIVTVFYVIGLSLTGIPAAFAIGLIAGLCRLIPYLDLVVGIPLIFISILTDFHEFGQFVMPLLVFLLVQSVDGMLITPRVIGDKVGIHPLVIITAIIAFSDFFGIWGVLFAIPIIATVKTLWTLAVPVYLASPFYYKDL